MTANELTGCFELNEFKHVCREEIPISTYIPGIDCEATLLHLSTTKLPDNCERRNFKLSKTFWILLYMSNQWLFVTPEIETFTIVSIRNHYGQITRTKGRWIILKTWM
jgi:hypothetical protein